MTPERLAEIRAMVPGNPSDGWARDVRDLLAALDAATAELASERSAVGRLNKLVSDDESEACALKEAIDEHLPAYRYDLPNPDDCTEANEIERVEYAGADIRKLTRERDAARAALGECERQLDEARAERGPARDPLPGHDVICEHCTDVGHTKAECRDYERVTLRGLLREVREVICTLSVPDDHHAHEVLDRIDAALAVP